MSPSTPITRRGALRLFGAGAGAAIAAGALGACAPSASTPEPAASGAGIPDDGVKDFTFTAWSLNEASTKDALQAIVNTYASSAGAKVTTSSYPFNDYLNQVLLQVRGGTLAGAIQLDVAWLATLAATGKLVDMSSLSGGADYVDAALGMGKATGRQFALPWATAGIGPIANKELLDRAGVSTPPKTIAEFETTLQALKGLGNGVVPYAAMTKVAQLKDIIAWIWTFGSDLLVDGKFTLGDDPSVEALTWYKKLYDTGLIAKDVDRFDARALFGQGKVGFYDDAIAGRGAVVKASPDKELASKLLPVARPVKASGDKPRNLAWGHVVAVLQGDGAAAAAKFAKAITTDPQYTVEWFRKAGLPPTTKAGIAASDVQTDKFTVDFSNTTGANSTPSPLWQYPQYAQMETILATQVQTILVGRTSPKDGLTTARDQMQALIK